jgi:drug/metabolite transporter (DMT)-like permease
MAAYRAAAGPSRSVTPLAILLWIGNLLCDTVGQLALKAASRGAGDSDGLAHWRRLLARPALWLGIGCFVFEAFLWLAFLSLVPLSQGVMMGSLNIVAVMVGGWMIFGEAITPRRATAIVLIAGGVGLVGWSAG